MDSDFTIRNEIDSVQPSTEASETTYTHSSSPFDKILSSFSPRAASPPPLQYAPSNHFSLLREQQLYNYQVTQQLISAIKWVAVLALIALILFASRSK